MTDAEKKYLLDLCRDTSEGSSRWSRASLAARKFAADHPRIGASQAYVVLSAMLEKEKVDVV